MRSLGPRTVVQLVLVGFVVVALPLTVALVTAIVHVGELSKAGRVAVFQAAQAMQTSRVLVQRIVDMQRYAQQYQVLGDKGLLKAYNDKRSQFQQAVQELQHLDLGGSLHPMLKKLVEREDAIHNRFTVLPQGAQYAAAAGIGFPRLVDLGRSIMLESGRLVGEDADRLRKAADHTRYLLIWEATAVIPATLLLAALFSFLIARPLRQLDRSIRGLGSGDFDHAVEVRGPPDLVELGERLDWLRERLAELEAQKVTFLRHMSHELKTPLTAIREGAELLNDQVAGPLNTEQSEIAAILAENSVRLQRLIEDLLQFSVARPPQLAANGEPVALDGVVSRVLEHHRLAITARDLHVESKLSQVRVVGDPEQLRIILDNLVSNAVKYSPSGANIRIALEQRDGCAVLDVQDSGPGISREERRRVFEAFYQGSVTHAGPVKGTGLGLAIAREYVQIYHGNIEVLDSSRGAHLRVSLPLAAAEAAS